MIKYSEKHNADYDTLSGQWVEEVCGEEDCEFCIGRPRVAQTWIRTDHTLPHEEDADEMGMVWAYWNNEVVLTHYHSVRFSDMWNIKIEYWKPKPRIEKPKPPKEIE